jgi:hypothetical protein
VQIADHEIVHVMGFWHTSDTFHDFHSATGCPGSGRPDRVRYHAAVMYSRPPGNQDVDNDSPSFMHQFAERSGPPVVSCDVRHFRR